MTIMGIRLEQTQTVSGTLNALMERLLDVTDYFIYKKKVTASEGVLFGFVLSRAVWYSLNGVKGNAVIAYLGPSWMWTSAFIFLTLLHLISFFSPTTYSRAITSCCYAFVWMFLFSLSVIAPQSSPAAPTFAIFALLSAFIAVRLFRDAHAK